jgi:hypothetical protein
MNKLIGAVVAVLALSITGYFLISRTEVRLDRAGAHTPAAATDSAFRAVPARNPDVSVGRIDQPEGTERGDALDRIESRLPKAQAGEPDAQFEIYELLTGCRSEYPLYFSGSKSLLGAEEAAIRMEALRSMDEHAVDIHELCHRLMEEQPALTATADSWLEKAVTQNHPKAQTARAAELLAAASLHNPAAGKSAPPNAERDARELLAKAIVSGDPHVLWMLGELRPALGGSAEDTNKERWAMELAACSRGLDCSPEAKWVKRYCKADPANLCPINANAEEMIRSNTGSDFEMIKLRAQEINALIDAGNARQLVPSP